MGSTPLKQNDFLGNRIEKNCQEDIIAGSHWRFSSHTLGYKPAAKPRTNLRSADLLSFEAFLEKLDFCKD